MVRFPVQDINQDLELGTLEVNSDELISAIDLADQDISLSAEELELLAKTDDLYKSIENSILNYDEETGIYYDMGVFFKFSAYISDITNTYSDPEDNLYKAYKINMETNNIYDFTFDSVSGNTTLLSLYPPYEVESFNQTGRTYDSENPISNDGEGEIRFVENGGKLWHDGDFLVVQWNPQTLWFEFDELTDMAVEERYWRLTLAVPGNGTEETELGIFSLSNTSPFNSDEDLIIYTPTLYGEIDDNNRIEEFRLKWHINRNGVFTKVSDPGVIGNYYDQVIIQLGDSDGTTTFPDQRVSGHWEMNGLTEITLDKTWSIPPADTEEFPVSDYIIIDCTFGMMHFMFYFL